MRYHALIPLLAAIACLGLAVFVNRAGPRTNLSRVFVFLALALVFWNLNFFVLYFVTDYDLALSLTTVFRVGAFFVPPAIFHLSVVLAGSLGAPMWRRSLCLDYSVAVFLLSANAAGQFVTGLHVYAWGFYSVGTRLYDVFSVFVLLNFLLSFALVVRTYITTTESRMRLQLRFWLLGLAVALPLGVTHLLPVYGIPFYPLGNLGSAVWATIVGYAIARHRLLDIDIVVTKGIAYAGVMMVLVAPVFGITLIMQRWAFGEVHYEFSAELAILLTAVGVLFARLRAAVERALERSLFRQKYESREAMTALAGEVVRILDRDKLIGELSVRLANVLDLEGLAVFLRRDFDGGFEVRRVVGTRPGTERVNSHHPIVGWLEERNEPVLREEADQEASIGERRGMAEVLEHNAWAVCVPFVSNGHLIGFLGLQRKRQREAFTSGDLNLLNAVATEATVALENARLYEEVRRSKDIINRAGRLSALGTLAAGIAHEIRNPLVSIQTFFQLAPNRLDDEEFMTSFLRLAESEVERISRLISELLTFARTPTPAFRITKLSDVVGRTITLLEPQARTERVELRRIDGSDLRGVLADQDQLVQVLINIVLNAIQATPGGGHVTVETRFVEEDGRGFCQIEVRDTGPGMPPEVAESIFNPFFTTKDKGTGLGLAISHQIVAECGGFINVDSSQGEGSVFTIQLPAATAEVSSEDECLPRADAASG